MCINILRDTGQLIDDLSVTLDFPVQYALTFKRETGFKILVYHERKLYRQEARDTSSDVPFAAWKPDGKGLQSLTHEPYHVLSCCGLLDQMNEFCQEAYEAWKEGQDAG